MNGFEKRAQQIKKKIINSTLELLKTWDSDHIRISDIAKTANVSQVTIYNYFGSKDALLREVMKKYINDSLNEFLNYINGDYPFKEKIERMILQEKEYSLSSLTPFFINQFLTEDPEFSKYVENIYNEKVIPVLLKLLEEGKKSGEISEKITIQGFLLYIQMSMKFSREILETIRQSGNMDLINEMVHIFFYGICGKP